MFKRVWKATLLIFIFFSLILAFGFRQHGNNNQVIKSKNKVATKNIYYVIKLGNKEHKFKSKEEILKFIIDNYQIKSKTFIGEKRILNGQMVLDTNSDTTFAYKGIKTLPAYKDIHDNYVDNKDLMINSYIPNYAIYKRYYDLNNNEFETKEDAINSIIKNVEKRVVWTGYYNMGGKYFNPFNPKSISKLKKNLEGSILIKENFINLGNYLVHSKPFHSLFSENFESLDDNAIKKADIFEFSIGLKPYSDNNRKEKNLYVFKFNGPQWRHSVDNDGNNILRKNISLEWLKKNVYGPKGFLNKYKATKDYKNWFFDIGHHKSFEKNGDKNRERRFNRGISNDWNNYTQYLATKEHNKFLDFEKFEILPNYNVWGNGNYYGSQWQTGWHYPSSVFNNYRSNSRHDIVFNIKINEAEFIEYIKKSFGDTINQTYNIINGFGIKIFNDNLVNKDVEKKYIDLVKSINQYLKKEKTKKIAFIKDFYNNKFLLNDTKLIFNEKEIILEYRNNNGYYWENRVISTISQKDLQENDDWTDNRGFNNIDKIVEHVEKKYVSHLLNIKDIILKNSGKDLTVYRYNKWNLFMVNDSLTKNISKFHQFGVDYKIISLHKNSINWNSPLKLNAYSLSEVNGEQGFRYLVESNNINKNDTLYLGPTQGINMAKVFKQAGNSEIEANNPIYNPDYAFLSWAAYGQFIQLLKSNKIFPTIKYGVNGLESILASKGVYVNDDLSFNSKQSLLRNYRLVLKKLINKATDKIFVIHKDKKQLVKTNFYNGWYSNFYAKDIYYNSYNDIISSYEKYINENSLKVQEEIYD